MMVVEISVLPLQGRRGTPRGHSTGRVPRRALVALGLFRNVWIGEKRAEGWSK